MSWIRTASEAEASGYVKTVYEAHIKSRGWVSNILLHSLIGSNAAITVRR
jgi:hypothetical protein